MLPEGRDQEAVGETLSAKHVQGLLTFSQLGSNAAAGWAASLGFSPANGGLRGPFHLKNLAMALGTCLDLSMRTHLGTATRRTNGPPQHKKRKAQCTAGKEHV